VNGSESNPDFSVSLLRGNEAIRQASVAAQAFGEVQLLNPDELARLCIVVEELVANLYDHGGLGPLDEVVLSMSRDQGGIGVSISDPGAPFDPWTALPKTDRPERGGGVGIEIVRAWALFTSYDTSPHGNRLEFLLPIHWDS